MLERSRAKINRPDPLDTPDPRGYYVLAMATDTNTGIEIEYLRGKGCDWIAYISRPDAHALTVRLTRKDPALRGVAGVSRYWVATARGGVHVTADTREAATLAAVAAMTGGAK